MSDELDLVKTSEYLLSQDAARDYSDEEIIKLNTLFDALISNYSWPKVYEVWVDYLHTKCKTDEEVINFARNYYDYAHELYIPDALHFISYLHYRVNTHENDDAMQIFDSLAITVLEVSGDVDMMKDPLYTAERDPRIQAEIEKIREQEKQTD